MHTAHYGKQVDWKVLSLLLCRILLRIIGSLPLIWEWSADHSQITPQMRILVAVEAVDGRKGIDSLARLCQERLQSDPFSGCLFVFRSRRGTAIRILVYD